MQGGSVQVQPRTGFQERFASHRREVSADRIWQVTLKVQALKVM